MYEIIPSYCTFISFVLLCKIVSFFKKKYSLLLSKKMSTPIKNSIAYKEEKSRPPPQNSYLKHVCRKAM